MSFPICILSPHSILPYPILPILLLPKYSPGSPPPLHSGSPLSHTRHCFVPPSLAPQLAPPPPPPPPPLHSTTRSPPCTSLTLVLDLSRTAAHSLRGCHVSPIPSAPSRHQRDITLLALATHSRYTAYTTGPDCSIDLPGRRPCWGGQVCGPRLV
ncbi:hypothetical protein DFP73DRAFT_551800 [Morchella snyderi]|nr:hypothetical protein DFP73DRAFT_551800 [Morchella snyderi]